MKYHFIFCKCGRIHPVSDDFLQKLINKDKSLLHICSNCGKGTILGGDKYEEGISLFQINLKNLLNNKFDILNKNEVELDQEFFNKNKIGKTIYGDGLKVLMENGNFATNYVNGKYYDFSSMDIPLPFPENMSLKELESSLEDHYQKRSKVNMKYILTNYTTDILKDLSGYMIDSFDWSGTCFEYIP